MVVMDKKLGIKDELTKFLLYTSPNGEIKVEVFFHDENIWLTQKMMAELFSVGIPGISKHLDNIYSEGELDRDSTISILETVQKEGNMDSQLSCTIFPMQLKRNLHILFCEHLFTYR